MIEIGKEELKEIQYLGGKLSRLLAIRAPMVHIRSTHLKLIEEMHKLAMKHNHAIAYRVRFPTGWSEIQVMPNEKCTIAYRDCDGCESKADSGILNNPVTN